MKAFSISVIFALLMWTVPAYGEICTEEWWRRALPVEVARVIKDPDYLCRKEEKRIIHLAAEFASPGAFNALMEKNPWPDAVDGVGGNTSAILAAKRERPGGAEILKTLANREADLDIKNNKGNTPLMWAAYKGQTRRVEALISGGATLNVKNHKGYTALALAAFKGRVGSIRVLVREGAGVNIKENSGNTPLMWAAHEGHVESVEALLEGKAHVHVTNNFGLTAEDLARKNRHEQIVKILKEAG